MYSTWSDHVKVQDNITPKCLRLGTEFISVSKKDNEKEEIPTSFLLLHIIMDFVLVRLKISRNRKVL